MRGNELLDILEHIDPALIEQADQKPKAAWLRWTALAAGLALIIGLGAYIWRGQLPVRTQLPTISLIDHAVAPQRLTGVQILGNPVSGTSQSGTQGCPPVFQFCTNLVVEARAVEILPDVYTDALTNYKYHILKLQTLDVINGRNIPEEFYLRLPAHMSTELDRFDSLILSLGQVGIENYMLVNQTTRTMEAFSLVFEVYNYYSPHYGSVAAFTNGVLDISLWNLEGWGIAEDYTQMILEGNSFIDYPAQKNSTPADTKATILNWVGDSEHVKNLSVETQSDLPRHTVFDYVKPFKNGVFAHRYYGGASVRYTRLINGFHTTESILVANGVVTYEGEAFTQADLSALPNLGAMIENLDLDTLEQPHAAYYEGKDIRLWQHGATGKYAKLDGQVYGIVKVTWRYLQNGIYDGSVSYYDTLYYLVSGDGTYRIASWEELQALIGDDEFLVRPTSPEELERGY